MLNNTAASNLLMQVCLMEASGIRAVKAAYVQLNEYLNRPPLAPHQIQAYARDLSDWPSHIVVRALEAMRCQPGRRFLPLPWEVIEFIQPKVSEDEQAADIAANIVACISSCGHTQPQRAEEKLGPIGWAVACKMGDWQNLCATLRHDEINTFRAQARGIAKAQLQRAAQQQRRVLLEMPAPSLETDHALSNGRTYEQVSDLVSQLAAKKSQGVL